MTLHDTLEPDTNVSASRDSAALVVESGMLDQSVLKEILDYDRETGVFTWRQRIGSVIVGQRAGSLHNGHWIIRLDGKVQMAARLAWLYEYGVWPTTSLRFRDDNTTNVAIANLRLATKNAERFLNKETAKAYKAELRAKSGDLTQENLKKLLHYDPDTGVFVWLSSGSGRKLGQPAGSAWNGGYRFIHIFGRDVQAARLAWLYVHGELPDGRPVRFDDNDPSNLRISNLRLALTVKELNKRFRTNNPDSVRNSDLKKYDGMTLSAFNALLESQGGVCAVCKQPEKDMANTGQKVRNLNVDHNHTTNAVRGILCSACNRAIGLLADDPGRMEEAAAYVRRHMKKKAAA